MDLDKLSKLCKQCGLTCQLIRDKSPRDIEKDPRNAIHFEGVLTITLSDEMGNVQYHSISKDPQRLVDYAVRFLEDLVNEA